MLFLLAEILNFQGSTHQYGVGSFSNKNDIKKHIRAFFNLIKFFFFS